MRFPLSTGEAARLLGVTEPELAETVRRAKVDPGPPIVAGRRLWGPEHLREAAVALGRLTPDVAEQLDAADYASQTLQQRKEACR